MTYCPKVTLLVCSAQSHAYVLMRKMAAAVDPDIVLSILYNLGPLFV